MADLRWLEQRSRGWYAVQDVPRSLRETIGKRRFVKSLGTRHLHVAQAKRHAALAAFQLEITQATSAAMPSSIVEAGMAWRATLAGIDRGDPTALRAFQGGPAGPDGRPGDAPLSPRARSRSIAEVAVYEAIQEARDDLGDDEAAILGNIAFGHSTPLLHYLNSWLSEGGARGPVREHTKTQYRSEMAALELWLLAQGLPPTIEALTKRVAGRYVSEELTGGSARPATVNRKVSSASSYWRWLEKRGHVESNVWANQSLSKVSRPGDPDDKRPFTDGEVLTLLSGKTDDELADAIRVAALSGMRLGEIYGLTVAACADGWFDLRRVRVKTKSGQRRIPIHADLEALVERRTKGKGAASFLFHEAGPQEDDKVRSDAVGKRFGKYRQRVGVHEKADGDRQSRIDFHSFRRWFITKARVGFDRAVVAAIVGHEAGNITDDVYSGGPDDAVRIACVASVRLPVAKP